MLRRDDDEGSGAGCKEQENRQGWWKWPHGAGCAVGFDRRGCQSQADVGSQPKSSSCVADASLTRHGTALKQRLCPIRGASVDRISRNRSILACPTRAAREPGAAGACIGARGLDAGIQNMGIHTQLKVSSARRAHAPSSNGARTQTQTQDEARQYRRQWQRRKRRRRLRPGPADAPVRAASLGVPGWRRHWRHPRPLQPLRRAPRPRALRRPRHAPRCTLCGMPCPIESVN